MNIEVKLTFGSTDELTAFFARGTAPAASVVPVELLAGARALNDIPAEVQDAAAPAKRTRKSKTADAPVADAAPAAVAPEQEATAPTLGGGQEDDAMAAQAGPEVSEKSYTVDDVRKALQAYSGREGFPAAAELVKSFGASRITELKADDYAAFIAKTEEKAAA